MDSSVNDRDRTVIYGLDDPELSPLLSPNAKLPRPPSPTENIVFPSYQGDTSQDLSHLPPLGNFGDEESQEDDRDALDWAATLERGPVGKCTNKDDLAGILTLHSDLYSDLYTDIGKGLARDNRFKDLARSALESMKSQDSGIPDFNQASEVLGSTKILSFREAKRLWRYRTTEEPIGIFQTFQRRRLLWKYEQSEKMVAIGGQASSAEGEIKFTNSKHDSLKKDMWCFIRQMSLAIIIEVAGDFNQVISGVSKTTKDRKLADMDEQEKALVSSCECMLRDGAEGLGTLKRYIEEDCQRRSCEKVASQPNDISEESRTKKRRTYRELFCSDTTFSWLQRSVRGLALVMKHFSVSEQLSSSFPPESNEVSWLPEGEILELFAGWVPDAHEGAARSVQNSASKYSMLTRAAMCRLLVAQQRTSAVYQEVKRRLEAADEQNVPGMMQSMASSWEEMGNVVDVICTKCGDASCAHGARSYDFATLEANRPVNISIVDAYMNLIALRSRERHRKQSAVPPGENSELSKRPRVLTTRCGYYSGVIADLLYIADGHANIENTGSSASEADNASKCKGHDANAIFGLEEHEDVFQYDYLLIPIPGMPLVSSPAHPDTGAVKDWSLVAVDFKKQRLEAYTSHGQDMSSVTNNIRQWLRWKILGVHPSSSPVPDGFWPATTDFPTLANHIRYNRDDNRDDEKDAGIFICKYADFRAQGLSPSFPSKYINYFRARIAHELLIGRAA